jgi:hypothetical protein
MKKRPYSTLDRAPPFEKIVFLGCYRYALYENTHTGLVGLTRRRICEHLDRLVIEISNLLPNPMPLDQEQHFEPQKTPFECVYVW